MKNKIEKTIQPDWWSKSFAGAIFGLSLAIALGNLIVVIGKHFIAMDLLVQLAMWSIPWLWMPLLFISFLFHTGKAAIFYMAAANLLAYACLFLLRG
ncbi:hypothetical protein ACFODO_16610 [Acinetobacter sichuanensis]|uniref:Uncharacterized protein n=1 Tax=Acinetobacter sichuanensis TaxID=2136183 RepID=A0A371YM12_9GAMM|nr:MULTISPECIES: hypothetical protein [Acinetobacter]MDM1247727.1 hypothetical protein [Acinetobacter sp. R933-2]MDM1768057.1 hypothetical protein [Acinetobacter sp. 226-4]MDQ9021264.1 hypothetical protein [Acinetobacter sichuanensis]RFC82515.1 hypothetical protein C9E89_016085 [Acinetobacter sichuanensis]